MTPILISIGLVFLILVIALAIGGMAGAVYDEVSGDRARREYHSRNLGGRNYLE